MTVFKLTKSAPSYRRKPVPIVSVLYYDQNRFRTLAKYAAPFKPNCTLSYALERLGGLLVRVTFPASV
jgi:hypothetical protein